MTDSTAGKPNLFDTRRFTGPAQGDQIISVGFSSDVPLCDFCAGGPAVMYFPVEEFEILHPQMLADSGVVSGDRFYADAGSLGALRRRYTTINGEPPIDMVIMLWRGAREHRRGDAVHFPPGTNPEKDRES